MAFALTRSLARPFIAARGGTAPRRLHARLVVMAAHKVDAQGAQALVDSGTPYLDVRTEAEFTASHVPGAVNVPVFFKTDSGMTPNPDFVQLVKEKFPDPSAALVVGCQAGKRSEAAAQLLEQAGYTELTDMTCGFGGWLSAGLPTQS